MKVSISDWPKNGGKQKISVKVEGYDTYSLNSTLAIIIHPALIEFKKKSIERGGCPGYFIPHTPDKKLTKKQEDAEFKKGVKEWHKILDAMIWSFSEIAEGYPGEEICYKEKKPNPKSKDFGDRLGYSIDKVKLEAYHARLQLGLNYFGQYYEMLWW